AIYREETKNPSVTIPRATYLAVIFIGVFYAITSYAVITGMGISQAVTISASNPSGAFFDIAKEFVGEFYYKLVTILLAGSIFACHLAIHNATTRYVYSLSRDGVFPKSLGIAHRKHSSPSRASVTCSIIYFTLAAGFVAMGLTPTEMYSWFAGLASYTILVAMAITSLSAFVYFQRNRQHKIGLWEGRIAPLASVTTLGGMVYLATQNFPTLIGGSQVVADLMLLGVVAIFIIGLTYALWLKKYRNYIYMKIGRQ
ncbi:MAG: APC family permease, partial [Pyrinomonadaceae bacterium]